MKAIFGAAVVIALLGLLYLYLSEPQRSGQVPVPAPSGNEPISAPVQLEQELPAQPEAPATLQDEAVSELTEEGVLEQLVGSLRAGLPEAVSDSMVLTDAIFLPRMRIVELIYVTRDPDREGVVAALRNLVANRRNMICAEGRDMFALGATLRNSLVDQNGRLFQRVYVLPEECA